MLKGVTETVHNEVKEQKGGFLSMLLGILVASLLVNLLTGRGTNRAGEGFKELVMIIKWIFNATSSFT